MKNSLFTLMAFALLFACTPEQNKPSGTEDSEGGKDKTVHVTDIHLDRLSATIKEGESIMLIATVTPENADNKSVSWSSSSNTVATVDANGKVTGIKAGTATITARCESASANCTITVTTGVQVGIYPTSSDPMYAWSLGGEDKISVVSAGNWTLSCDAPWLTISQTSGSGTNDNVVISTVPNKQDDDRTAVIRFESNEGSQEFSITQHCNIFRTTFLKTRKLSHAFKVYYTSGVRFSKLIVMLPYAETDQYQTIRESQYGNATLATSSEGVKYLYYTGTNNFPASGSDVVKHDFTVDFQLLETDFSKITQRNLPYDTEQAWYKRYTGKSTDTDGSQMIDPTHSWVVSNANSLWDKSGGDVIEYARLCYEFVAESFTYGIYDGDNSVNAIIGRMSGDCGNQHAIWMSLMRAKGVPARPIVMYSPDDFTHVRAEFCVAGYGWIPVDVTYHQGGGDYFGRFTDDNLVVMNHEFAFKAKIGSDNFNIGLLQVVAWWYWVYVSGTVDGDISLTYADIKTVDWGICGTMQSPQWDVQFPIPMAKEGDWWVARDLKVSSGDEFKFVHNNSWKVNFGGRAISFDSPVSLWQDGPNICPGYNGNIDVYLNVDTATAYYLQAGSTFTH